MTENDANLLLSQKEYTKALAIYQTLPVTGVILNQIGICYFSISDYENAILQFKKILTIKNNLPEVYNNIANCYVQLKKYKTAETCLLISIKLQSDNGTHFALGNIYFYMKNYTQSLYHYHQMTNLQDPPNLYNCSFSYLAQKDFLTGFSLYENRLKTQAICPQTNEPLRVEIPWIPNWNGQEYKHLLVIYEQGIGDNIQYFRFILQLSRKFPDRKITYFCKNTIAHLFSSFPNIQIVLHLSENIFDYKCYIMSLPFFLKIETISPLLENYISVKSNIWKIYFDSFSVKKIGFVHNGLLSSFIEKYIPLSNWHIFNDVHAHFFCLGKDIPESEKQNCPKNFSFLEDTGKPFEDTSQILCHLDLLISVDTAIVHLAGVQNKIPVWLLLGYGSDWRWFHGQENHWYSNVELIRMTKNKELSQLLPEIKKRLHKMLHKM